MPPARRARLSSWPSSSTAATDPSRSRGWLSALRRSKSAKRPRRASDVAGDDGTPLTDEILLVIFSLASEIADVVRCAATCRRWRRLVSGDAAFICRARRRPAVGPMALGFFHNHEEDNAAAARFVATDSASRRFGLQPPPSLNSLVEGLDGADGLFDSSRVVASRNGLVVVDLRRGKHDRALKLCVCNPMTGDVHILPRLSGKDGLGQFACTVVTADDHDTNDSTSDPPSHPASFRLVMVYSRRDFTAFRSYSSDDGCWSEEAKVRGVQVGKKQMSLARNGVVTRDGGAVYWAAKGEVFGLRLDTLEAATASLPWSGQGVAFDNDSTFLGLTPEGRLCAVQLNLRCWNGGTGKPIFKIDILTCGRGRRDENDDDDDNDDFQKLKRGGKWLLWDRTDEIWVDEFPLDRMTKVKLRWFCEKSGVVFFTVGDWFGHWTREVYALDLRTKAFEKLASHVGKGDPWGNLQGYEMGQAAYLASLAEPEGMGDT